MIVTFIKEKKAIILFLGLFSLLIVASYYLTEPALEEYPAYRVDSPAPDGTKGFYQSLAELNYPVERFTQHPKQLDYGTETATFLFNPPLLMEQSLVEHYLAYVQSGGTLFLITDQATDLFGLKISPIDLIDDESTVTVNDQTYQARLNSWLRLLPEANDRVLISDDYGVIALSQSYGAGEMIQIIEPSWFSNQLILENDHLALIADRFDLSNYQQIYFETYHYLAETSLSVLDVTPDPIILFSLISLTIGLLFIWLKGKRYGPARGLREQDVRFGDERIRALANWQIKGQNYHEGLTTQVDYLKFAIFERTGIPVTASKQDYQQALERLLVKQTDKSIRAFIDQLDAMLNSGRVNKQEFLEWSNRIDQIRREVEAK
ncbi:DUF4350 domain-containing protein [Amphibacillus indicireducens]|uniref:DUF4350 domain-containing protein n=1 Tax=Amphibacillus indicireducens TaxID=1076330 RepID=A0ABP7V6U1_9BACI